MRRGRRACLRAPRALEESTRPRTSPPIQMDPRSPDTGTICIGPVRAVLHLARRVPARQASATMSASSNVELGSPPSPRLAPTTLMSLAAVYIVWSSTYLALRFVVEELPALLSAG